jgi:hypothetical protein
MPKFDFFSSGVSGSAKGEGVLFLRFLKRNVFDGEFVSMFRSLSEEWDRFRRRKWTEGTEREVRERERERGMEREGERRCRKRDVDGKGEKEGGIQKRKTRERKWCCVREGEGGKRRKREKRWRRVGGERVRREEKEGAVLRERLK